MSSRIGSPLKAVIFDMDGTLVDSEPIWQKADEAWLGRKGIQLSPEDWLDIPGKGGANFVRELMANKGLKGNYQELLEEKNQNYLSLARSELRAFPEMLGAVKALRSQGLKIALASASSDEIIETSMTSIGYKHLFDILCSGDSVERNKPDPMLFLHTAELLAVRPDECLVVEDSRYGVEAACRAGMLTVAVPQAMSPASRLVFEQADLLFETGMAEFTANSFLAWLKDQLLL